MPRTYVHAAERCSSGPCSQGIEFVIVTSASIIARSLSRVFDANSHWKEPYMRTPLLAGNWKMYKTVAEAVELVEALLEGVSDVADREVLICPPATALYPLAPLVTDSPIKLGAQNMYAASQG